MTERTAPRCKLRIMDSDVGNSEREGRLRKGTKWANKNRVKKRWDFFLQIFTISTNNKNNHPNTLFKIKVMRFRTLSL